MKAVESSIDREGKVRDGASSALSHVRISIRSYEKKIRGILEGLLKQKDLYSHLQDYYIAERNNRWVIPVKVDFKGSVPGIVHDISNTGETVYIEPYSIQHLGNELEYYRAEEKLEEYRILRMLSSLLREHLPEIREDYQTVAEIDALQAMGGFSAEMSMSPPEINEKRYVKIINGRHPLLWKTLRRNKQEKDLVPLNLEVGRENSCMVITGSNAGGKTVALKTIGVLSLMALSGMHTPAGSGSSFPFLERILADIGDEQSIEQSLSTFSAHITRISEIIRHGSRRAMIIIDELGTGTDPEQGGALSCAILRKIKQIGALSVVSTHLGMLKAFAHAEEGMINSAMEMKEVTDNGVSVFRPTFKLVVGEPGTSHAFEIAESLGLHRDIIREARDFITDEDAAIESLISELELKTRDLNSRLKETEKMKKEVDELRSELKLEFSKIESMKRDALSHALSEAEDIISRTKREARDIISAIKKSPSSEKRDAIKQLDRKHGEIKRLKSQYSPDNTQAIKDIKEGKRVFINTLRTHGIVSSINERAGRCRVLTDGKEIAVPITDISEAVVEARNEQVIKAQDRKDYPRILHTSADMEIDGELNVIGQRVDPALSVIERYLNDASLSGVKQVKIIHGLGTGILSRAVRDFLADHPLVENSRVGNEDEGGEAVTMVEL
jgi:DNA mismatch repair protein MutS2